MVSQAHFLRELLNELWWMSARVSVQIACYLCRQLPYKLDPDVPMILLLRLLLVNCFVALLHLSVLSILIVFSLFSFYSLICCIMLYCPLILGCLLAVCCSLSKHFLNGTWHLWLEKSASWLLLKINMFTNKLWTVEKWKMTTKTPSKTKQ